MDSFTQIALGAAVGIAAMGRRTAPWKPALWGAVAGTLPDLDVFVDHGDAIANMVLHRSETHALFWLGLASLPLAAAVAALNREWHLWRRWWLAIALALLTHPLLDAMTVYGTRLWLPFSDAPVGLGSVFVIDPLYTLPLLVGVLWAMLGRGSPRGRAANAAGLVLSTAYLAWGVAAQRHVEQLAQAALAAQGLRAERLLVTPTPFNSLLWRVLAVSGEDHLEGFHSLLDADPAIRFDRFDRGQPLAQEAAAIVGLQRVAAFSRGFYALRMQGERLVVIDLRMGQEPTFTFAFAIAERRQAQLITLAPPVMAGGRPRVDRVGPWLWRRMLGTPLAPPR